MTARHTGTATRPQRSHRTQAERSERTRALLLDATIGCLVDLGYARTSVTEICKRAGVSRGAQQHHFATRAELMAQAIEHLATRLADELGAGLDEVPAGPRRVAAGIDRLWQAYSGDLSTAALELWVAARTDPELRAAMRPVDRALGRSTMRLFTSVSGMDAGSERAHRLFWMTVNLTRGLALEAEIGGGAARRRAQLDVWKQMVAEHLEGG